MWMQKKRCDMKSLGFIFAGLFVFSVMVFSGEKKEVKDVLVIADFNSGKKPSNIGGDFGRWDKDPKDTTQTCIVSFSKKERVGDKGYSLRIDYDVDSPNPAYNGAWFKLNGIDITPYKFLNISIKGDKKKGFTEVMKVELKNEGGEDEVYYITGIEDKWKDFKIPLDDFLGITDFSKMSEFVIVFEDVKATKKKGTIYIDNIYFSKK